MTTISRFGCLRRGCYPSPVRGYPQSIGSHSHSGSGHSHSEPTHTHSIPHSIPTHAVVTEAAKTFSGLNAGAVASAARALHGFDPSTLANIGVMREAATAFESMRAVVAPQIPSGFADTLAPARTMSEALARPSPFQFTKTMDDFRVATQFQPRVAEAFTALALPTSFTEAVGEALRASPAARIPDIGQTANKAIADAVVLAGASATTEIVAESSADMLRLSPAERRELQGDIVNAIAALGTLVALLVRNDNLALASATLALLAILISIYWRLTGKLKG